MRERVNKIGQHHAAVLLLLGMVAAPALGQPAPSGGGGAPAGYDRNVTHVRWTFTGTLLSSSSGSVSFAARIR